MLNHILKSRPAPQGSTIERIRTYELTTAIAFGGRRRSVYRRVVALSGARPGDRVLDIGCNGGYLVRLLAAAVAPGGQVAGVDPSQPAIAHAARRAPANAAFAVGAAQDLRWPDGSFDVVTSTLAVHHIPEADRATAFAEMFRVTRPGGRLLIADFRPSRWHRGPHGMKHAHGIDLAALAGTAGFRVEASGDLPLLRYIQATRPALRGLMRCDNDQMLRRAATTILIAAGVAVGGTLIARRLGYNLGTNTIVRCRQGHVFTTIWIPGIKLKEIDLVVARIQRCPVGNHWSLVVPVRAETLSAEDRDFALSHHDAKIP